MKKYLVGVLVYCHLIGALLAAVPLGRVWERVDSRDGLQANRFCKSGGTFYAVGNSGAVWSKPEAGDWVTEDTFVTDDMKGIAGVNGTMVAVGANGRILRKSQGGPWGAQASGVGVILRSITHGGGWFVAVGDGGTIIRSSDGVNWSVWASGVTKHLHDVIWDGTRFWAVGQTSTLLHALPGGSWMNQPHAVGYGGDYKSIAVGTGGYVINGAKFSPDGTTWTNLDITPRNDVASGSGVFVAVAGGGGVSASDDGINWASIQTTSKEQLVSVEWTGSEFVALTPTRNLVVSTDGYRWKARGLSPSSLSFQDGCWAAGQYVVVGDKQSIYTSPDGRWWTTEKTPLHDVLRAVAAGGGRVVAVGSNSSILSSSDGRNWQKAEIPGYWDFFDVCWTGTAFVTVGTDGIIMTSPDGLAWTMTNPGRLDATVWDGTRFLAFSGRNVLQSADGNDWAPLSAVDWLTNGTSHSEYMRDIAWNGSSYLAVGEKGWILKSSDGITWTKALITGASYIETLSGVSWSGSRYVAVGKRYSGFSEDGVNWTMVEQPSSVTFSDVAWNGSSFLAVGGDAVRSSVDGITWTLVHTRPSGDIRSIAWSGTEWVIAGGEGLSYQPTSFVARSANGASWTSATGASGVFTFVASAGGIHVAIDTTGAVRRYAGGAWTGESSGLVGTPVTLLSDGTGFRAFSNWGMSTRRSNSSWMPGDVRVSSDLLRSVVHGGGKWVVGTNGWSGSEASIMTSADGRNWTKETFPGYQGPFLSAVWTGTGFEMVAGNCVYTSATGYNWLPQATSQWSSNDARCIVRYNNESIVGGSGTGNPRFVIWNRNGAEYVGSRTGSYAILSLVAGPSEVLAVGTNETLVSQDGRNWSVLEPQPALATNLLDVIHTPFGFFAAGDGGVVWKSPDGDAWTKSRASETLQLNALAWGDGKLVAVGSGLLNSPDGQQWGIGSISSIPSAYQDVVWGGGRFVAVANGSIAYSTDGVTWQRIVVPGSWNSVIWTGSAFVAGTADGMVLSSADGSSWQVQVLAGDVVSIVHGNGIWMAGTAAGTAYLSQDGINWSLAFNPATQSVTAGATKVGFAGGRFFYLHQNATFHSADGLAWTRLGNAMRSVVWTGTQFVGVGDSGLTGRSSNGTAWNFNYSNRNDLPAASVWTGSEIIVVGSAGKAFSSPDGVTWTGITSGTTRSLVDVVWTGAQAVALDSMGSLVYFGSGAPLPAGLLGRDLSVSGGVLMAACDAGKIARLEPEGWSVVDTGAGTRLNGIAENTSGLLAVGASGTVLRSTSGVSPFTWELVARSAGTIATTVKMVSAADGSLFSLGSDGKIRTSPDGKVWTLLYSPAVIPLHAVEKVGGDLLAFGNLGAILRIHPPAAVVSENSGTSAALRSVASSGARLVAVGDSGTILLSKAGDETPFGYDRWIAEQGAPEGEQRPDGDFDQDGVENLVGYLHGFSSSGANRSDELNRLPAMTASPDGPSLAFEIDSGYQDVEVKVLRTSDFVTWTEISQKIGAGAWSGTAVVTESEGSGGRTRVSLVDESQSPASNAFYRLSVKRR